MISLLLKSHRPCVSVSRSRVQGNVVNAADIPHAFDVLAVVNGSDTVNGMMDRVDGVSRVGVLFRLTMLCVQRSKLTAVLIQQSIERRVLIGAVKFAT